MRGEATRLSACGRVVGGLREHQGRPSQKFVGPVSGGAARPAVSRLKLFVHGGEPAPAVLTVDPPAQEAHLYLQHAAADRAVLVKVDVSGHGCWQSG